MSLDRKAQVSTEMLIMLGIALLVAALIGLYIKQAANREIEEGLKNVGN